MLLVKFSHYYHIATQWSGVYPKEINQVLTDIHTKKTVLSQPIKGSQVRLPKNDSEITFYTHNPFDADLNSKKEN